MIVYLRIFSVLEEIIPCSVTQQRIKALLQFLFGKKLKQLFSKIYDATPYDYMQFLCSMLTFSEIYAIAKSYNYSCSNPTFDANYPSFIGFCCGNLTSRVEKFQRIVNNVRQGATSYKVNVTTPKGSEVIVSSERLVFGKKYAGSLIM